jgi:hypothetical protein
MTINATLIPKLEWFPGALEARPLLAVKLLVALWTWHQNGYHKLVISLNYTLPIIPLNEVSLKKRATSVINMYEITVN